MERKLEQAERRKLQETKELQVSLQLSKLIRKLNKDDGKYVNLISQILIVTNSIQNDTEN